MKGMIKMNKRVRYNIVGFYPQFNEWCLITLGNFDKEHMEKVLEDVKQNPKQYGIKPERVTEYNLDACEEDGKEWWNGNLD